MKRAGIVLCGGRSQRMGRPKALLPWFGRSMIEHVVGVLAPCVDEVVVVTSAALALPASLAARIVVDREPARGPLAALRDGLVAVRAERAFVTSVDAPFLARDHVDAMFAGAEVGGRGAVLRAGGFLQVLSAVYACAAWRDAEALLAAGIASPAALVERLGIVAGEAAAVDGIGAWTGFNTPADYLALARRQDPHATALVEWRLLEATASGPRGDELSRHSVAIGLLGDVLRGAAPAGAAFAAARAAGRLSVSLSGVELERDFDPGLPVGPGEHVVVRLHVRTADARPGRER